MSFIHSLVFVVLITGPWAAVSAEALDINRASAEEIARHMVGIGTDRAESIVSYRKRHGPFASVDELTEVKGVGKQTVEKNRSRIAVHSPADD